MESSDLDESLAAEIAQHLQLDPSQLLQPEGPAWGTAFALSRSLQGQGFHRDLLIGLQRLPAAEGQRGCSVALLQPLPSSIFADPYQLEDLTRPRGPSSPVAAKHAYSFKLFGPLDLEMPAPACRPTALLLQFNLSGGGSGSSPAAAGVELSVPLHAKYPAPQSFGFTGWRALLTGHVAAEVPLPWIIQDCRASGGAISALPPQQQQASAEQEHEATDQQQQQCAVGAAPAGSDAASSAGAGAGCSGSGSGQLLWLVPAGNLDHQQLVSWGTLLVTGASAVLLSFKAVWVMMGRGSS